jgi:hypothetical protein
MYIFRVRIQDGGLAAQLYLPPEVIRPSPFRSMTSKMNEILSAAVPPQRNSGLCHVYRSGDTTRHHITERWCSSTSCVTISPVSGLRYQPSAASSSVLTATLPPSVVATTSPPPRSSLGAAAAAAAAAPQAGSPPPPPSVPSSAAAATAACSACTTRSPCGAAFVVSWAGQRCPLGAATWAHYSACAPE